MKRMSSLDWIAWLLVIIGGINWGLLGLFDYDLVQSIFGEGSTLSRIIFILVGLSAVYLILSMPKRKMADREDTSKNEGGTEERQYHKHEEG